MRSRMTFGVAVLALLANAAAAWAGALSADEKKWVRQCLDGLRSSSDRVREGAERSLAAMGADCVPALVPMLGSFDVKNDAAWDGLLRALDAIGAVPSANALDGARTQWPKGTESRLFMVVAALRAGEVPRRAPKKGAAGANAPAGAPQPDDPDAEAEVFALLAEYDGVNMMSGSDPQIRKIVALGRRAVPALLKYLQQDAGHHRGIGDSAATQALEAVVTEADIPAVAEAMRNGALQAASCLKKFKTEAALAVLLDVIGRGFLDHSVLEGLEPHTATRRAQDALLTWLEKYGTTMDFVVGEAAAALADRSVKDAVPLLLTLIDLRGDGRWKVGRALAALGEKSGIRALIEELEEGTGRMDEYHRHSAGEELNRIVGMRWYVGSFSPDRNGPAGNFDEAAKRFRAWWTESEAKLRFDSATRRWSVN